MASVPFDPVAGIKAIRGLNLIDEDFTGHLGAFLGWADAQLGGEGDRCSEPGYFYG